ncbi:hypothetical protein FACS1894103_1170 [Campylobacterota bacterium]|nr:hypothetical protein FACS1894103_1170 [Campylobacterota bacterium]
MSYEIFRTKSFKKSFKKIDKTAQKEVLRVVALLADKKPLPASMRDHLLSGAFRDCRECHIKPDLLLIYRFRDEILELALIDVGTHSDLF